MRHDLVVVGLPRDVMSGIDAYLAAVDRVAPGFVVSLHVTGSIALGDYQPSISDVDLVAVGRDRPSDEEVAALVELHRVCGSRVDVLYVTRDDLGRDPSPLSLPCSLGGVFRSDGAFEANPVAWRVLSTRAIAVRGAPLTRHDVWFDADVLRRWNLANLDGYWSDWLQWARAQLPTDARVRHEYGLQWLVLGVPRLHYTIATLEITSKSGAGRYALEVSPQKWHDVLAAALSLRADQRASLAVPVDALWRDAIDLAAWLIEDAHRLVHRVG
jgi:hypothetical protein